MRSVEEQIAAFMQPERDRPPGDPSSSYLICSAPRVGSNMLAAFLTEAGAGEPQEYLNQYAIDAYRFRYDGAPVERDAYLAYLRRRRSANGVFGMKAHYHQVAGLFGGADGVAGFLQSFSRLVVLERRDKLLQAISSVRAAQSGVWFADTTEHAAAGRAQAEGFDAAAIARALAFAFEEAAGWAAALARCDRPLLRISYEALVADLPGAGGAVLTFLGLDPSSAKRSAPTVRIGDDRNAAWHIRFLDMIGRDGTDPR